MIAASLRLAACATFLVLVTACGGGGGGGGIGGTGLTSSGTISGTGSIFVNGVRFDVDARAPTKARDEGGRQQPEPATEAALLRRAYETEAASLRREYEVRARS